ncbi:MAG: DnaD domain protein [Oscillospiraceae bacterium]|nr:DnaD domain protein [Oscillospiraceae bacterium]
MIDKKREDTKMITDAVAIPQSDVRKLLSAASADAALLYIFLNSGNRPEEAGKNLNMSEARLGCAGATLRQLGLWPEQQPSHILSGERPSYGEADVLKAMDGDVDFRSLYGEVQRLLGRSLNTEELKILLGFVRYLGLSNDVISVLICYCKERARQRGSSRNPSLRTIEKEAYAWAERGIDTVEAAAAFIQTQNVRNSRLRRLMDQLQIRGRSLTPAEERYAQSWLDMGFAEEVIAMAYERTCLNTGGLNWAYMNKILQRWHEQNLHSAEAVQSGDRKQVPKGASGQLGDAEMEAIQQLLRKREG